MQLRASGRSDAGLIRARNEDAYVIRLEDGIFAVADGMGGHAAGNIASRLAADAVRETAPPAADSIDPSLSGLLIAANQRLLAHAAANPECEGMGTTLTVLAFANGRAICTHIGDSRLYLVRRGKIRQITRDHTWVQEEVERGDLTPEEARDHPYANALTRALGIADQAEPETFTVEPKSGDVFLLCSDGLTKMLDDDQIASIVTSQESLEQASAALIAAANQAGGVDNITVVLVRATV